MCACEACGGRRAGASAFGQGCWHGGCCRWPRDSHEFGGSLRASDCFESGGSLRASDYIEFSLLSLRASDYFEFGGFFACERQLRVRPLFLACERPRPGGSFGLPCRKARAMCEAFTTGLTVLAVILLAPWLLVEILLLVFCGDRWLPLLSCMQSKSDLEGELNVSIADPHPGNLADLLNKMLQAPLQALNMVVPAPPGMQQGQTAS